MNSEPTTRPDRGLFATGRITTWCVLLILAGSALPLLRTGPGAEVKDRVIDAVTAVREGRSLSSVSDTTKTVTTRARMRGIVAELTLWTSKFGLPRGDQLTEVVGKSTATDAWGRPILFSAPTSDVSGWLRSNGPDGKQSEDDIYHPISRQQLTSKGIAR